MSAMAGGPDLSGKVVLVSGGNGGIGLAIAQACAAAGADVAIWGTNEAKNDAAAEVLSGSGARVFARRCDVSDEAQVVDSMAATVAELGRVDTCFANAGVGGLVPFVDMTLAEWRRVTSVNLDGAFLTFREAARHMIDRGDGGSLVAISSVSAIDGAPRMEHYASAKAGLLGLVRALAVELARYSIRCNTLLPGWVETDMNAAGRTNEKFMEATTKRTPVRRWGVPEDMGKAAVFLADPTYTFHTGDQLVVDGGYSIF
jgi:NAD(P)-dependent dehydrogenase (short-subunit alcohol dehydrogenase family)